MITEKQQLFAKAPRQKGVVAVGDSELEVYQLSVHDRFKFYDFCKKHKDEIDLCYAYVMSLGCPVLHGCEPVEIIESLDAGIINEAGLKILELSGMREDKEEEKKP